MLIILPNRAEIEVSEKTRRFSEFRNIAGEILAVMRAVEWGVAMWFEKITIFYDCRGIREWAVGKWLAKNELIQFYKNFIDEYQEIIEIEFVKVVGHSNNIYNNRVDKLAKNALKVQ